MQSFTIKRRDNNPVLRMALGLNPDVPKEVESVVFNMMDNETGQIIIARGAATFETVGTEIVVSHAFTSEQTAVAGVFIAEFEVLFAGGSVETFPNSENIQIVIRPDIA